MENRYQRFLLALPLALAGQLAWAQSAPVEVVSPDVDRREIKTPDIDRQDFEVGAYIGMLSIEDFSSEVVWGLRGAWHITEDFFFELNYGSSEGDLTSYEELSGGVPLFDDDERDYTYYNLNVGWNLLPGEIYFSEQLTFKSDFYLIGGAGSTDFLGDNWFTVSVGAGYRLLYNDWLSLRIDVRDHIFDREAFGDEQTTNNIEWTLGFTAYF